MPKLCLIAAPGSRALENVRLPDAVWLAPGEACLVEHRPEGIDDLPVDVVALTSPPRPKRLLISDMDSTMITVECIDELAAYLGLRDAVAAITRRAMNGEIGFEGALTQRVALLEGLPEAALLEVWRERVRLMPGARTLVQTMRAWGAVTALVSGGFTFFTQRVREACGFELDEANELEVRDGRLTGRVVPPIRGQEAKLAALERLIAERGIDRADTLAAGDGANDLPMLRAAGLGVAFRAHPRVEADVTAAIRHGDLTALLYLQGMPRHEFTPG